MTMPKRPNLLFILTDEQRGDTLGRAGNRQIQTPHLDALADDGVLFENAFCAYPVCTPSRYSLLSGLYVHQHGGGGNSATLAPGLPTFPRLLREAGYRTHAVGKMHFTPTYLDVGFDRLELAEQDGDGRLDDDYHRDLRAHGLLDRLDIMDQRAEFRARAPEDYWRTLGAQTSDLPEEWHSTTWIADRALRALDGWDADGGNLLMVGFVKPHHPFDPPAPWDRMYDPDRIDLLPGWTPEVPERDRGYSGYFPNAELTPEAVRHATAFYYATISQIDHHIGRMTALLRRKGLYDDTLVVFTSDHGDYMGFHHMLLKGGHIYDPLVRVPLLIKFPGGEDAGTTRQTLASLTDLAPTILRQARVEPPPVMKGLNLAQADADRPFLFASSTGHRYMARSRTHKLILGRDHSQNLFFDLERDPLEMTDLFEEPSCQAHIEEYRRAITNWLMFDAPPPVYRDTGAPSIAAPNVPPATDDHRAQTYRYFEEQFERTAGDGGAAVTGKAHE